VNVRTEFGNRIRELRARSGMSQEVLAHRAGMDRSYLSGVERGLRNISLDNIERLAKALNVSISYMFAVERLSDTPAYQPHDFTVPLSERFKYHLDSDKRILSFQVSGLLNGQHVDHMSKTLLGICNAFQKEELSVFVDHRDMKATDGKPAVYSIEVAEKAVLFQQELTTYSNKVVVLCNSEFMVQQMNFVTATSGIHDKSIHLFDRDKDMIGKAYELLDINGNDLIQAKA